MTRGSTQAVDRLIRSSSPIELVEPVRKRARGNTPGKHARAVSSCGMGMPQGKSDLPVLGKGTFMVKQGTEGRKQSDSSEGDCGLGRSDGRKFFALEAGGNPVPAGTKRKNLENVKRLLLGKEDWLGTRSTIILMGEEEEERAVSPSKFRSDKEQRLSEYEGDPTVLEGENIDELPKLFDSGIDQKCTLLMSHGRYHLPHSRVDSQGTYIQVGNACILNGRTTNRKANMLTPPPRCLLGTVQDIATPESMLLNFEDPIAPGNCRKGLGEDDTLSVLEFGAAEDSFDLESVLTWSSSNYIEKSPLGLLHRPSVINIDHSVENTCSQASSPPLPLNPNGIEGAKTHATLLLSEYMTDYDKENPVEQQNISSLQFKVPSSLDACATSVAGSGGPSEDSQWIDMIANEYYWDELVMKPHNTFFDKGNFFCSASTQSQPLRC